MIKYKNVIPLYQQIRVQLSNDILSGIFKVGEPIDTETVLMKKYNASRTTVRKAISSLVEEGIITRTAGKGSFVKKELPRARIKLTGTFGDILNVAKNTSAKIIRFEFITVPLDVREKLGLGNDERVLRVDRVRFVNNTPFLYSVNYLPEDIGKLLSIEDIENSTLTELFESKCNKVLKSQTQEFGANVANDVMAKLLNVQVGFPLLQIKRVTISTEDRPINLFISNFRSDIYIFTATFSCATQEVKQ